MSPSPLPEIDVNGGFPAPPADGAVRVVAARHAACGASTRIALPAVLTAGAVRRVRCAGCARPYETERAREVSAWRLGLEREWSFDGRAWRLASVPLAAGAVLGALLLIQGGADDGAEAPAPMPLVIEQASGGERAASANGAAKAEREAGAAKGGKAGKGGGASAKGAELVRGSSFSLALPRSWERTKPTGGATFAAVAAGGGADATLWIEEDPKLDLPRFVSQSLTQLEALAGSARVVERVPAPTIEGTVVRLAADAPPGEPAYEVTLRAAGPYRYYLATTVQPDADRRAVEGAALIAGSLTPEGSG